MTTDAQRKRRLLIFGGVVLVAIVVVGIVIAASSGGSKKSTAANTAPSAKTTAGVQSEFSGIPQKGNVLGSASAPAKMVVFADLQCPFCAKFENSALPAIVKRYVRPGKLQVVFQPIAILGNDSVLGARASAAAAQQNKMFDFNAMVYRNQGEENTGYMTTGYLKKQAAAAGLDPNKLATDISSPQAANLAAQAQNLATSGHVSSTPSFFIAKQGQPLSALQPNALDAAAFYADLDKLTS